MIHANISVRLEELIKGLQSNNSATYSASATGLGADWMLPVSGTWSGNLAEIDGTHVAFDRTAENQVLVDALADPANDGTSLDLALASLQLEQIAVLERSFKQRHVGRIRSMLHANGRRYAHGHDNGPLVNTVLEPLRTIAAKNKNIL